MGKIFRRQLDLRLARRAPMPGSAAFGKAFEHWVLMELVPGRRTASPMPRSASGGRAAAQDVGFIGGDMDLAIEVKGTGLATRGEESRVRHAVVVSLERAPRRVGRGIEVLPWRAFVERL